jgi:hypothetical protein
LNEFVGVIGMDFLPYQSQGRIFATEPLSQRYRKEAFSKIER